MVLMGTLHLVFMRVVELILATNLTDSGVKKMGKLLFSFKSIIRQLMLCQIPIANAILGSTVPQFEQFCRVYRPDGTFTMAEPGGLSSSFSSVQDKEFDIIIVGGGTAGLVIAARLSEDANTRVLVIEAGADTKNDPRVYTPGLMSLLYGDKSVDWDYMTPPQVRKWQRHIMPSSWINIHL